MEKDKPASQQGRDEVLKNSEPAFLSDLANATDFLRSEKSFQSYKIMVQTIAEQNYRMMQYAFW
jgi:hypothetical protein